MILVKSHLKDFLLVTANKRILFLILFFNLLFASCSRQSSRSENIDFLNADTSEFVGVNELESLRLQSFTRLLANDNLINFKDSLSLDLTFNFMDLDSSVSVVAYTNSMQIKQGTIVEFVHQDHNIDVFLYLQDYPKFKLCTLENFITANEDVKLKLQFLNAMSFGPVITIWNQSSQIATDRKRNLNYINVNTADCSTLKHNTPISQFGMGTLWGLELFKSKVKSIKRTETYVL